MKNLKNNYHFPSIHHSDATMQKKFEHHCETRVYVGADRKLPVIHCLKNGNYVIWSDSCSCNQSAWDEYKTIEGFGWSDPFKIEEKDKENCRYSYKDLWEKYNNKNLKKNPKTRKLKGNYVGFHSWWAGAYGHILHDNLPLLAYLKATLNDSFRFLMLNDPIFKNILKAIDEEFYNRVEWIDLGEVITVDGSLCCGVLSPDGSRTVTKNINLLNVEDADVIKKVNAFFGSRPDRDLNDMILLRAINVFKIHFMCTSLIIKKEISQEKLPFEVDGTYKFETFPLIHFHHGLFSNSNFLRFPHIKSKNRTDIVNYFFDYYLKQPIF